MARIRDVILRGTRAAQPAAASVDVGTLYYVTDETVTERSNGATWDTYSDGGALTISAGTLSETLRSIVYSNSNGVSFGLNGSTVTASVGSLANINISAGTTSNNLMSVVFSNSNGVSFGLNGSTVTGSIATSLTNINVSAGTTSNNLSALVFSNSNGVSFGLNGSTVTASASGGAGGGGTISYFNNVPFMWSTTPVATANVSQILLQPFTLEANLSASYVRFLVSLSSPNLANFAGTTANTTFSCGNTLTHGLMFYTLGTGASSNSLLSYTSTSFARSMATSVSNNTTNNYTITEVYSYQRQGITTFTFSTSYAKTSANYSLESSAMQSFHGSQHFDIPFAGSLSPGFYVAGLGISTDLASNGAAALSNGTQGLSSQNISQIAGLPLIPGTTSTEMLLQALGNFTTNSAFFTTSGFNVSAISSRGNNVIKMEFINRN